LKEARNLTSFPLRGSFFSSELSLVCHTRPDLSRRTLEVIQDNHRDYRYEQDYEKPVHLSSFFFFESGNLVVDVPDRLLQVLDLLLLRVCARSLEAVTPQVLDRITDVEVAVPGDLDALHP